MPRFPSAAKTSLLENNGDCREACCIRVSFSHDCLVYVICSCVELSRFCKSSDTSLIETKSCSFRRAKEEQNGHGTGESATIEHFIFEQTMPLILVFQPTCFGKIPKSLSVPIEYANGLLH